MINEPYDIAYAISEVEAGATGSVSSGVAWLNGLVEPGKYALAGHSDGAQAVAALVYSQASAQEYATTYGSLTTHPFAVIILSGSELSGVYAAPTARRRCCLCRAPSMSATSRRTRPRCFTP